MFTKRELKTFLESMCTDARVVKLNFVSTENFVTAVKCKVDADAGIPFFNKHFAEIIDKFSKFTSTTWIVRQTCPKVVRFVYRKVYACHLSSFNKKKVIQRNNRERNKQCRAKIDFKVKKRNRNTCKNDPYLREDLNLTIIIHFEHTHLIRDREHFNLLRGSKESDEKIFEHFDSGFTAMTAKAYNEMWLIAQHGNDPEILSNSNLNPTLNHITYLYTRYRKDREMELRSVDSLLAVKKSNLENAGGTLIYTDNVDIALVITPFMKRVFSELSSDVVVVDSTRVNKLVVTCLYVPSKVGVLPIACALHASQDEDNFTQSFLTVKITIENQFGRHFEPTTLMTNDSKELINAAAAVFPQTRKVLIPIDMCRNLWAWMFESEKNLSRKKRHLHMVSFKEMLYADNFEDSEKNYKDLKDNEQTEDKIKEYVDDVWSRRDQWSQNDVYGISERHVLESSLIFFKELVVQRCMHFNVCMMVDVLVKIMDDHYCRIIRMYAKGEESLAFLTKFLHREKDIIGFNSESAKFSSKEYRRSPHLKTKKAFAFRTDTLCCNCNAGANGHLCEHLCGIINAVDTDFNRLPHLNEQEREFFAKLSGINMEELKNLKTEIPVAYDEGSDKELEKDFSADDEEVDPDYQPDDLKADSSPKVEEDDSSDYYVLDIKSEKPDRIDPLEELLMDATDGTDQIPSQSKSEKPPVEPVMPPEELKPKFEKALKELNSEFRRLSKLFKENANRANLATMTRLSTEMAKIRPIERVNFKNLSVQLNADEAPPEKKIREDEKNQ